MVYVEIIHKPNAFSDIGMEMWYTRMRIDSSAQEVQNMLINYFLTDGNIISLDDDESGESFKLFKCDKEPLNVCKQMLIPFGQIKDKFLK